MSDNVPTKKVLSYSTMPVETLSIDNPSTRWMNLTERATKQKDLRHRRTTTKYGQ